jgi:hypothetical protein
MPDPGSFWSIPMGTSDAEPLDRLTVVALDRYTAKYCFADRSTDALTPGK